MNTPNGTMDFEARLRLDQLDKDLQKMREAFQRSLQSTEQESNKLHQSLNNLAKGFVAFLSVQQAQQFVADIVRVRSEFQKTEITFETMLKSKEKANALVSEMVDLAAKTPFGLKDVNDGAKRLLAFQVPANEVTETLRRMGDVASGLGVPMGQLIHVYGQVKAQGKLMTNDLYQFMNAGIPIIAELSKVVKKSEQEIKEMVSQGKIGFGEIQQVIKNMTNEGGLFYNLMAQQSKTLDGQISNLKDNFQQMMNELGKSSEGVISSAISGVNYLVENYQTIGKTIAELIAIYGTYKVALMSINALRKFNMMVLRQAVVEKRLAASASITLSNAEAIAAAKTKILTLAKIKLTNVTRVLNATMLANPYVLVAVAIASLGYAMVKLITHQTEAEKAQKKLNDTFNKLEIEARKEELALTRLMAQLKATKENTEDFKKIRSQIINQFGEYFSGIDKETASLKDLEQAYNGVIERIRQSYRVKAMEKSISEASENYVKKESEQLKNIENALVKKYGEKQGFEYYEKIKSEILQGKELGEEFKEIIRSFDTTIYSGFGMGNAQSSTTNVLKSSLDNIKSAREIQEKIIKEAERLANVTANQNNNKAEDNSPTEVKQEQKNFAQLLKEQKENEQKINQLRQKLKANIKDEQLNKDLDAELEKQKSIKEQIERLTGEKTEKSDKSNFDNKAHLRQTQRLEIDRELAQEKAKIDLLADGYEKERQLIDFHYKEKAEAIRRGAEDMRLALEKERKDAKGKMTQEAFELRRQIIDQTESQSNENNVKVREQQQKKLTENLVKEYQTFQEKKDKINQNHLEVEKALRLRYEGDILQEKLKLNEQARQKEISDLELNQKNVTSVISQMYSDLSQKSAVEIDRINERVQKLKQMLAMGEYNPLLGQELGVSQETFQTWKQDPKQLESLNNQIKNVENTATASKNVFGRLGDNIKKAFDAKNPQAFQEALNGVASETQGVMQATKMFADTLFSIGEATGDTGLQELADDLQNLTDIAGATMQGAQTGAMLGGPAGAAIGGALGLVGSISSKIAEAEKRHREAMQKIRQAEINQQRTLNKLLYEENMLQKDKESIFGVKELSKAIGYLEIYRQQHELLKNSLKKNKTETIDVFGGWVKYTRQNVSDLDKIYIKTGRVKTGLFGWGKGRDVFSSITQVYPELIDKTGKFNKKLAESILSSREFRDNHKEALQEIIHQYDRMEEAQKQFEEYLKHTFGELGTSIVDSIVHSLKEGEDAFEHFAQAVGKVMGRLGKQLIYDIFVADEFKKLQEKLKNDYENSKVYKDEIYYEEQDAIIDTGRKVEIYGELSPVFDIGKERVKKTRKILDDEATAKKASQQAQQSVADFSSAMRGKMEQMRDVYQMFADQSKALGFDVFGEETRQAQEKAVSRMTIDQADELSGQFRLMTQIDKQNLDVNMQILEKSKGIADSFKELQKNSAQQLKHLAGIEVNTFVLHEMKKDITSMKAGIDDINTKGIKIR